MCSTTGAGAWPPRPRHDGDDAGHHGTAAQSLLMCSSRYHGRCPASVSGRSVNRRGLRELWWYHNLVAKDAWLWRARSMMGKAAQEPILQATASQQDANGGQRVTELRGDEWFCPALPSQRFDLFFSLPSRPTCRLPMDQMIQAPDDSFSLARRIIAFSMSPMQIAPTAVFNASTGRDTPTGQGHC
jgi:hypothetical protein